MPNEFIIKNGYFSQGNSEITGSFTVVTGSARELQVTSTGVNIGNIITDTHTVTGSLNISGSITATSFTGSLLGNASTATSASFATTAATASFATNFTASNILVAGTITAQTLVVQTVTSSIVYSSGSNIFGSNLNNTQQLTGSVTITGSLQVNGRTPLYTDQTASLTVLSASYAATASRGNATAVTPFVFNLLWNC